MSNAFSVTELRSQDPRVRVCDATLGYGVKPLRGMGFLRAKHVNQPLRDGVLGEVVNPHRPRCLYVDTDAEALIKHRIVITSTLYTTISKALRFGGGLI